MSLSKQDISQYLMGLERAQREADKKGQVKLAASLRDIRDDVALKTYGEPWCNHESRSKQTGICECGDRNIL